MTGDTPTDREGQTHIRQEAATEAEIARLLVQGGCDVNRHNVNAMARLIVELTRADALLRAGFSRPPDIDPNLFRDALTHGLRRVPTAGVNEGLDRYV